MPSALPCARRHRPTARSISSSADSTGTRCSPTPRNLSLFASRRLIELRLGPTPDAEAGRALAGLAQHPPEDAVLLVAGEVERKTLTTAWVKAFEEHGVLVVTQTVERTALPRWIRERLGRKGVAIESAAAASLIADRVEGNLLAAHQEIEKLALLHPPGAALCRSGP